MYDDKNLIYFFTILEAIEKINLYSKDCKDDEEFYDSNHQMNFNALDDALDSEYYMHLDYLKEILK